MRAVEKNRESHTAKVNYEDALARRVGAVSAKAHTPFLEHGAEVILRPDSTCVKELYSAKKWREDQKK